VFLWIVKGLLLVLAVAAAVMWPVSRERSMGVIAERYTAGPASGEDRWYSGGCRDGWAVFGRACKDAGGGWELGWIREAVKSGGEGWRWRRRSEADPWEDGVSPTRWGPLRWYLTDIDLLNWTYHNRVFAAP